MDALDAILTRRSIRRFTDAPVSDEAVTDLLRAAMSAPTAANHPWRFVVIRDRALMEGVIPLHPHALMLKTAGVAVLICADPSVASLQGRWPLDCAAAAENMLIAANALGLGACWVGIYPVEERMNGCRELFSVPESVNPFCMIAVGHPAERKDASDRLDRSLIHYERWGRGPA